MIGDVLVFLRKHLDEQLRVEPGLPPVAAADELVVFVDGDKVDPITFKLGAVSLLLINLEEERVLRAADPYARPGVGGGVERVNPEIRLFLYVLFVARYKQYDAGWNALSRIVEHFQAQRVFERETMPGLPPGVERLGMELVTLKFAEQNEVWNALRTTHLPSVLYRVSLVAFRDRTPRVVPVASDVVTQVRPIP